MQERCSSLLLQQLLWVRGALLLRRGTREQHWAGVPAAAAALGGGLPRCRPLLVHKPSRPLTCPAGLGAASTLLGLRVRAGPGVRATGVRRRLEQAFMATHVGERFSEEELRLAAGGQSR